MHTFFLFVVHVFGNAVITFNGVRDQRTNKKKHRISVRSDHRDDFVFSPRRNTDVTADVPRIRFPLVELFCV